MRTYILRLLLLISVTGYAAAATLASLILTAEPNRNFGYNLTTGSTCPVAPTPATSFPSTAPDITAWVEIADILPGTSWEFHWINPYGIEEDTNVPRTFSTGAAQAAYTRLCHGDALATSLFQSDSNRDKSPVPGRWEVRVEMAGQTKSAFFEVLPVTCAGGYTVNRIATLPIRLTNEGSVHPDQPKGVPGDVYYGVRTNRGCVWTAVSNSPWIEIAEMCRNAVWDPFCDQKVGSGNGYFHYRWDAARAGTAQTGSITVGGQTIPAGPPDNQGLAWAHATNPATGVAGAVAQGSLFSVLGFGFCSGEAFNASTVPWPTSASGGSVSIWQNSFSSALVGVAALQYVGPSGTGCQINAQLPWETPPGTYLVRVDTSRGRLWAGTIEVVALRPLFFSAPPAYPVLLQIADRGYSLMSASVPARPGETLVGYPDGLGQTSPPRATGNPAGVGAGQFATVNASVTAVLNACIATACSTMPVEVTYVIGYPGGPAAYQAAFKLPIFAVDQSRRYSLQVTVGGVAAQELPLFVANSP